MGSGIDAKFELQDWWPSAVGAAAGWVVLIGGLALGGGAYLSLALLSSAPAIAPYFIAAIAVAAVTLVHLTAPAALAGSIAGDLLWRNLAAE